MPGKSIIIEKMQFLHLRLHKYFSYPIFHTAYRDQIGQLINCKLPQQEIYFTSCGTESDNRVVDIAIHHFKKLSAKRATALTTNSLDLSSSSSHLAIVPHIVTCIIEHPAVICYLRVLREQGTIKMTVLQVLFTLLDMPLKYILYKLPSTLNLLIYLYMFIGQ